MRAAALLGLTLGTLALAAPAYAVARPPVTCNTLDAGLYVEGTATAPVLVATSYYLCTDGSIVPDGYASIGRYLVNGTYQAVTGMGQPDVEYVCKGTATYYEYTAEGQTMYIGCG
jgi:hypothetical protein